MGEERGKGTAALSDHRSGLSRLSHLPILMPTAAARVASLCGDGAKAGAVISSLAASQVLSLLRRTPLYRPSLVISLAQRARDAHSDDSVAHWDITEQWALACADRGDYEVADRLLASADLRFPGSWRVQLIAAFIDEARGLWGSAMRRYMGVVERDPLKSGVYKRQVAVLKAQKKVPQAIALLNYYTGHFGTDVEAWAELTALCLAEGRAEHALFTANEVLAQSAGGAAAHVLVADVLMTIGGRGNCLAARRHYGASVAARRKGNLRALYGMWMAATALEEIGEWAAETYCDAVRADAVGGSDGYEGAVGAEDKRAENARVIAWARMAIRDTYASVGTGKNAEADASTKDHSTHIQVVATKAL